MTEDSVFLVSEIWLDPEMFERFTIYRQKTMDILIKYIMAIRSNGLAIPKRRGARRESRYFISRVRTTRERRSKR